jgi:hypothetical protein
MERESQMCARDRPSGLWSQMSVALRAVGAIVQSNGHLPKYVAEKLETVHKTGLRGAQKKSREESLHAQRQLRISIEMRADRPMRSRANLTPNLMYSALYLGIAQTKKSI